MHRSRATLPSLPLLLVAACGDAPQPDKSPPPATAKVLEYDFGSIPHGEVRAHTFEFEVPGGLADMVPVAFRSGCSCGTTQFLVRDKSGKVRRVDPRPYHTEALQEGDQLLLELSIDTGLKEAADHPRVTLRGQAILKHRVDDAIEKRLPAIFHFSIDAPIDVRPTVHVDFGPLPRSKKYSQALELHPDRADPPVVFGPVDTTDPRVRAALREEGGVTVLDVSFDPGPEPRLGAVKSLVNVSTNLDGYLLSIPVSGTVIPDIVVEPMKVISFRTLDMGEPAEAFVNIIDYDRRRDPGFVVRSIEDENTGVSLAEHFEVRLKPITGAERATRVHLHYLGTLSPPGFRGVLKLAKPDDDGPITDITFLGFHRKT